MNRKQKWARVLAFCLFSAICLGLLNLQAFQERRPDVPYVPTPEIVIEAMLAMAKVNENDVVYDLGCGDGRIVINAAKTYGSLGIGIDIDPQRIKECHENARNAGVENKVQFFQADLFETEFSDASVLTLYLLTEVNRRLRPKFLEELKPGTRIVSHDFDMGQWKADKEMLLEDEWEIHSLYFWIVPANVSGNWTWSVPADKRKTKCSFELEQSFQYFGGQLFENKSSTPIPVSGGKITGDTLVFTLEKKIGDGSERQSYEGRIEGHTIRGTLKIEGRDGAITWVAKRKPSTQVPLDSYIKEPLNIY